MKRFRYIFLVTLSILILSGCSVGKKNLSVSPYILTKVTGLSGRADATVYLDTEGLYIALAGVGATAEQRAKYDGFINSLSISAEGTSQIANGDKVVATVTYDALIAEELKLNVTDFIKAIEVKDLTVGQEIDLFHDLLVSVTGIVPYATLEIVNNSMNPYISGLEYYVVGSNENIKNGDSIIISCNYDSKQAEVLGYYTDVTQMTYIVDGLDSYVYEEAFLDKEVLLDIARECADTILSETYDTTTRMLYKLTGYTDYLYQDNNERVDSVNLNQVIFMARDIPGTTEYENMIIFVFEAVIANNNYSSKGYYLFRYTNAVRGGDGGFYIGRNNPELRYVCGTDFDKAYDSLIGNIGPQYIACILNGINLQDN